MEVIAEASGRDRRGEIAAFVAFAILTGPVVALFANPLYFGLPWPTPISMAIAETLAGTTMLAICILRRLKLPNRTQVKALGVLLLPQIASGIVAGLHLHHDAPWGAMTILRFAAPLWLALLWGAQLIREEIPRAAGGAAIAGVGAFCLMTPVFAYRPTLDSIPMVGTHLLLSIAAAYTWAFAAPRIEPAASIACGGAFLLMEGCCNFVALPFLPFQLSSPFGWLAQATGICMQAAIGAVSMWLWFRLLQRMQLSAFAMLPLAAWTATVLPGVVMGWAQWRFAVAPAIALAAVVVGVRARVADEQPTALGLGAS